MAVGQSGGGKSIAVGTIINSLLMRYTPNRLKIVLIDPKQVEYAKYEGIPHLEMPVAYTPESAMKTLDNVLKIMESRYTEMKALGVRTYPAHEPKIVVFVDEFASLMVRSKTKFENKIARIAAEARAAGIVCVISTQTPNGEIMTKMMRVNFPCRLVFRCQTSTDSRIATGMSGDEAPKANKLIGRGDGFFIHENAVRFQAAYSPDLVTEPIVEHWKNQ
jgi:S-DNA-T family DNA segregation ATPase FtsK/SpoIIIE